MPVILSRFDSTLAFYRDHAEKFVASTIKLDMSDLYKPFLSRLDPGTHILDAGCGSGRDSEAFVSRGYQVTAIDASMAMIAAVRARGLKAHVVSFQQMTYEKEFDGIWACASLLHVPHRQISSVINKFARALRPRGVLYVSLKEGDGESIAKDGRFFSYFRQREFERLLVNGGHFEPDLFWRTYASDSAGQNWPWLNYLALLKH